MDKIEAYELHLLEAERLLAEKPTVHDNLQLRATTANTHATLALVYLTDATT